MDSSAPARILTVCTGTICGPSAGVGLLQAGLDQVVPGSFEVASAGTHAVTGDLMRPFSTDIVRTFGAARTVSLPAHSPKNPPRRGPCYTVRDEPFYRGPAERERSTELSKVLTPER